MKKTITRMNRRFKRRFNTEASRSIFIGALGFAMLLILLVLLLTLTPKVGFGIACAISVFGLIMGTTFLSVLIRE